MNRYMLPQQPVPANIQPSIYPWDSTYLNLTFLQLYEQARKTGYSDSFDDFKSAIGTFMTQMSNIVRYNGQYEVTPMAHLDQILRTSNALLLDDITISKIPYAETSNDAGGYTVIIG